MTTTPDDLLAQLTAIRAQLDALDPASPEYEALESKRIELAATAEEAADTARNPEALSAELEHLEKRLATFESEKISVPAWQAAMTSMNDPAAHAINLNAELDAKTALDRAAVENRIARLKKVLGK
ncbi:MAG: hypothetical protein GY926_09760 [bacterium]|nr:hypothetical protein [bacterium]MCP4965509.1 hypothetical protein [bacterium]